MTRLSRYVLLGHPQHVIQRGNNRSAIFAESADYRLFSDLVGTACDRHGCDVHAYVLMTNHVHLLMTPHSREGIGKVMQSVGRCYVRYFNSKRGRTGTMWEGRYRATVIDTDRYLLTCYRYIELNPVRSGQVARPSDYAWSSHRANALGWHDPLVVPHQQYLALGANTDSRHAAYRALFDAALDEPTLAHIRESTNKAWALGDARFRDAVTKLVNRRAHSHGHGGDRRSAVYRNARIADASRSLTP